MFLMPFQTFLFSINPDGQIILFADGYLTGVEDTFGSFVIFDQAVDIVVEFAALDKCDRIGKRSL